MSQQSSLLTFSKKDPQFLKHLWGDFSKEKRALVLESANLNSENEKITFEVVDARKRPQFLVLLKTFKIQNLYLSLCPLFLVLVKNFLDQNIVDEILALLAVLGVTSLQLGLELALDVQDHISGLDRMLPRSSNPALTSAWLRARDLKNLSWIFIGAGILLGLPCVMFFPELLLMLLPLLLIAILGFGKRREGLKYRSLIEGFVFLMFGPLLTLGFQYSFGGGFDLEVLFIGLLTGWFAVYQVHIKNFSQIVLASKVGFRNSVTKWGFDRSKKILSLWWLAFIVFLILYHQIYSNNEWFIINVILLVGMSVPVVLAFFRLQASLGSRCERTVTIASKVSQMALALWVLEAFWSFLQVEIF